MIRLAWQTAEPDALAARLARLGFMLVAGPAGPVARLLGADVAIVERPAKSAEGSLTIVDGPDATGFVRSGGQMGGARSAAELGAVGAGRLRLRALGWATVELERAVREFGPVAFERAKDDAALGARALLGGAVVTSGDPSDGEPALVLLEPLTEGRLAALLARHGEGPAVLYVAGPAGLAATVAAWRGEEIQVGSEASGPLGPSVLALGPVGGPEIVAVE